MPSLQIRDMPSDVYRRLAERAKRERRSLAQQALVELERADEWTGRRREAVRALRDRLGEKGRTRVSRAPVKVVREDRDR